MRIVTSILFLILFIIKATAQDKPIGYWESHLPYNSAVGVATDGTTLFTACNQGFSTYNPSKSDMEAYSKVEGMSDVGMQCVGYDMLTSTAVLVYANGNIDLFKNNTFYNIPDLKIKSVSDNKSVNQVYTENGTAYLSTSIGIILVDLASHNITETYQFIIHNQVIPVNGFIGSGLYFYAITSNGLYRANKNNPELQNFQVWQKIDSTHAFTGLAIVNDVLFLTTISNVFSFTDSIRTVYSTATNIRHISAGISDLFIGETINTFGGVIKIMDASYQIIDSFSTNGYTTQAVQLQDSSIWVAASFLGLEKRTGINQCDAFIPPGPYSPFSYDIYAYNKNVWIAHGAYNQLYLDENIGSDLSNLDKGTWYSYHQYGYPPFGAMQDFVTVVKDETDGTLYAGSFEDGLFIKKADGTTQILKQNSIFDTSISAYDKGQRQVVGLAIDHHDNLWLTLMFSAHQLYVKTKDSNWYKFQLPPYTTFGGPITIDNNDQVWYACFGQGGAMVYNTNGTISDPSDDANYHLQTGVGSGNLPSNNVLSIVCDKTNNVWIGTDNGIGIVSGCSSPFTQQSPPCDAQIPIVQYDQFAGFLFKGNNVRAMAVDGANRKWVGTDNGIWLLSPDAGKIIYRFTVDNSPLPSNNIRKITVDPVTGDVYMGTDQGLICYHSTAVDGGTTNQNVVTYPDPVPSGYTGTIAIKGLVANADVRITDIDGQLVYRTTALGGQAVWNGMDYKGHRPQSGVYLIFVSSSDGSQTYSGKMLFMQ